MQLHESTSQAQEILSAVCLHPIVLACAMILTSHEMAAYTLYPRIQSCAWTDLEALTEDEIEELYFGIFCRQS